MAQLGLEVAFWAPGLRAAGRWAPGVEGQLPVLMDWWEVWGKGEQRSGREKGDRVSQTSRPGVVTRGKGVLTQNPTDLGWQEPWGLRAASAAPWNVAQQRWPVQSGNLVGSARKPWVLGVFHDPPLSTAMECRALGLASKGPVCPPSVLPTVGSITAFLPRLPRHLFLCHLLASPDRVLSLMKYLSLGDKIRFFKSFKSYKKVMFSISAPPLPQTLTDGSH